MEQRCGATATGDSRGAKSPDGARCARRAPGTWGQGGAPRAGRHIADGEDKREADDTVAGSEDSRERGGPERRRTGPGLKAVLGLAGQRGEAEGEEQSRMFRRLVWGGRDKVLRGEGPSPTRLIWTWVIQEQVSRSGSGPGPASRRPCTT